MKRVFFYFLWLFCFSAEANIIDLLKDNQGFNLKKHLKKDIGSVIPNSLKADDFTQAFENKDFKTALKFWQSSLAKSHFAKSSNGSALYAYLLFQNGFEVLALNHLFRKVKPKELDPVIHKIWKEDANKNHPVWEVFYFKVEPQWVEIFSPELVFRLGAKYPLDLLKNYKYIEQLLSLPLKKDFDSFALEWSLMLSVLKRGDMDLATKLLSWFVSQTKDTYRKDQIYLSIARLLADIQSVPVALEYYQKVSSSFYFWLLAQEEMAWLLLSEKNYTQALTKALALNPILFDLSPSMYFVLALLQLKNCDNQGSFESLMRFKKTFSGQNHQIKNLLKSKKYGSLIYSLLVFYQSKKPYYDLELKQPFYLMRKDQSLKNMILLYQYIKQKELRPDFRKLIQKQKALIQALEKKIYSRLDFLLQSEANSIFRYLKWFHVLEAELAYRHQVLKNSSWELLSHWSANVSVYKSNGFLSFPFDKKEVWTDELSDYQWIESSKCVQSSYKL